MSNRPVRRPWLLYVLAWLAYLAVYASMFFLESGTDMHLWIKLLGPVNNVLPAAVLGLVVVWWYWRMPWRPDYQRFSLARHVAMAAAFTIATTAIRTLLFVVQWSFFEEGSYPYSPAFIVFELFQKSLVYAILASMTSALATMARLREEEQRASRAETLRARAELEALRAQLNPHFLFNTLHSLLALVRTEPEAAEDAIEQFADLLRYASRIHQETLDEVTFAEEWEFVENYLALESLRLGTRLRIHTDVKPGTRECLVPAFSLQPLVENAIRHGIAPRAEGGHVTITTRVDDGILTLRVEDDGPGAENGTVETSDRMGLRLVRQRLEALYGARAAFSVTTAPGSGFAVELGFPTHVEPFETALVT